jgi:NIPSNAP
MIYEFRTYTLKPRTLNEFLSRFGEALPRRLALSPLAAFWYTEIGPLNEVTHVWPYENVLERSRIRAEAVKMGIWPPKTHDLIADMRSEIFEPLPFSPPLEPSRHGPYFEMRTYALKPASLGQMSQRWAEFLPARLKLSPLIGVFSSDIGGLNQWVHIWAYPSLDQRLAIRRKAASEGIWPPPGDSPVVRQATKILLAAPFSPIQ